MDKQCLRRRAKEQRALCAARFGDSDHKAFLRHFYAAVSVPVDAVVAGYMPIRDELDVRPVLLRLASQGRSLALPCVVMPDAPLVFRRWKTGDGLVPGALGVVEPPSSAEKLVPDVVLVPLLAFDAQCHRLGYGGGYYDRTLAQLRLANPHVIAAGCAYRGQEMPDTLAESTDVALDMVVTEKGVVRP